MYPDYVRYRREEGRLAALLGDTAGAIRAYRDYLALRMTLGTALLVALAGCKSTAPDQPSDTADVGRTSGAAGDSAAIAKAHQQWIRAFQQHDPTLLEPLLADEIVFYGEEPFTKQHLMEHVRDTSFTLESLSQNELRVRVFGSARDVAVASGSVNARGRRGRETFNLQNRYTEVWVKRGGRWQCVAGQEVTWPVKGRS
jgi:ketosteroid isomerase-like protein